MDLKGLFGFWGVRPRGGIELGSGEPYREGMLGLELSGRVKPPWMKGESIRIPFPETFRGGEGKPLAFFSWEGERVPAISLRDGKVVFNFDPGKTVNCLLGEGYLKPKRPFYTRLPLNYSRFPRRVRAGLGRMGRGSETREGFPSWPIEESVEAIRWAFLKSLEILHGKMEVNAFWPEGRFCVSLTHDVDSGRGFENIEYFREIEEGLGLKSCWYIVGGGYKKDFRVLDGLARSGNEIGLHGIKHDNRIAFLGEGKIRKRIMGAGPLIKRYSIKGFRSPSLLRSPELSRAESGIFKYDSSVPDTERFSQISPANGCCSVFPFFREGMLEIPLTVPQDACLLKIHGPERILEVWKEKLDWISRVGGLACINTHTDSHFSGNPGMLGVYEKLLKYMKGKRPWFANPSGVAEWWLKRSQSLKENRM